MLEAKITKWTAVSIAEDWGRFCGDAIFVLGTGTSLAGFNYARLRGHIVIACNDAIKVLPDATYHLYGDSELYERYINVPYADGTKVCVQDACAHALVSMRWAHADKLRIWTRPVETAIFKISRATDELWMTRTVATAAIMMAWKLGATDVYTLGVDCYRHADGTHYADGTATAREYRPVQTTPEGYVIEDRHLAWLQGFEVLESFFRYQAAHYRQNFPRVYVISPHSPIATWPKCALEDVL